LNHSVKRQSPAALARARRASSLVAVARRRRILDAIAAHPTEHPGLTVLTPIEPDSRQWRPYMERHRQNWPHRYHNGGVWPMVGGFWVLALAAAGRRATATSELARLARANAAGDWRFTEWFNGERGTAEGMAGQTWNAALFLLAREGLQTRIF
jgi:hypothetical protein